MLSQLFATCVKARFDSTLQSNHRIESKKRKNVNRRRKTKERENRLRSNKITADWISTVNREWMRSRVQIDETGVNDEEKNTKKKKKKAMKWKKWNVIRYNVIGNKKQSRNSGSFDQVTGKTSKLSLAKMQLKKRQWRQRVPSQWHRRRWARTKRFLKFHTTPFRFQLVAISARQQRRDEIVRCQLTLAQTEMVSLECIQMRDKIVSNIFVKWICFTEISWCVCFAFWNSRSDNVFLMPFVGDSITQIKSMFDTNWNR